MTFTYLCVYTSKTQSAIDTCYDNAKLDISVNQDRYFIRMNKVKPTNIMLNKTKTLITRNTINDNVTITYD